MAFWCIAVSGSSVVAVLLYPVLVNERWVEQLIAWFNPLLHPEQGYWLVVFPMLGFPILGGVFAFLEGESLFKGQSARSAIMFLLAYPLPRWQVYLVRLTYLFLACFLLIGVGYLSSTLMIQIAGHSPMSHWWNLMPSAFLLSFLLGEIGLLLGIINKSYWLDRLIGLFLLALLYFPFGVRLSNSWLHFSLLSLALGEYPLTVTIDPINLLVLGGVALAVALVGGYAFERLEL